MNDRQFKRLHDILKTTVGEVKLGGEIIDPADLLMETTLISLGHVTEGKWKFDSTMQQEIFGPLLPYITYDNLDQALDVAKQVSDTSLGAYVFIEDKAEQLAVLEGTRSGGLYQRNIYEYCDLGAARAEWERIEGGTWSRAFYIPQKKKICVTKTSCVY